MGSGNHDGKGKRDGVAVGRGRCCVKSVIGSGGTQDGKEKGFGVAAGRGKPPGCHSLWWGCEGGQSRGKVETLVTLVTGWPEGQVLEARGRSVDPVVEAGRVGRVVVTVIVERAGRVVDDDEDGVSEVGEEEDEGDTEGADTEVDVDVDVGSVCSDEVEVEGNDDVESSLDVETDDPTPRGLYSTWWGRAPWPGG